MAQATLRDVCLLHQILSLFCLGFLIWLIARTQRLSQPGVNALRGPLEKGLLSVPGPWGEDVTEISWESLRMLARQTEVGRGVEKAQNPRPGCGRCLASRL